MAAPQNDAYFEKIFSGYGGVYTANALEPQLNPYAGMTAVAMYRALRAKGDAPALAAAIVYEAWLGEGIGSATAKSLGAGGSALGDVSQGISRTNLFGGPFGSLESFIGALETPAVWLRIAEGLIGVLLIATAVAHMTDASSALGKAARAVPLTG
jgi:hypothetical protein